jgi:hypothetical protein
MKKTNILTLFLAVLALSLAFYLGDNIIQEQNKYHLIRDSEKLIKENLKGLRTAQVLHKRKYGQYAANWKALDTFITYDSLILTDQAEQIIPRQYQEDSIIITIDTIGIVLVKDSLFGHQKFMSLDQKNIKKVPLRNHNFVMEVQNDTISMNFYLYIADEQPLDNMRRTPIIRNDKAKRIKGTKPLLSIGSKDDESLNISWSK